MVCRVLQYAGDNLLAVFGRNQEMIDQIDRWSGRLSARSGLRIYSHKQTKVATYPERESLAGRTLPHTGPTLMARGCDSLLNRVEHPLARLSQFSFLAAHWPEVLHLHAHHD